jgi:hypothetical protein
MGVIFGRSLVHLPMVQSKDRSPVPVFLEETIMHLAELLRGGAPAALFTISFESVREELLQNLRDAYDAGQSGSSVAKLCADPYVWARLLLGWHRCLPEPLIDVIEDIYDAQDSGLRWFGDGKLTPTDEKALLQRVLGNQPVQNHACLELQLQFLQNLPPAPGLDEDTLSQLFAQAWMGFTDDGEIVVPKDKEKMVSFVKALLAAEQPDSQQADSGTVGRVRRRTRTAHRRIALEKRDEPTSEHIRKLTTRANESDVRTVVWIDNKTPFTMRSVAARIKTHNSAMNVSCISTLSVGIPIPFRLGARMPPLRMERG